MRVLVDEGGCFLLSIGVAPAMPSWLRLVVRLIAAAVEPGLADFYHGMLQREKTEKSLVVKKIHQRLSWSQLRWGTRGRWRRWRVLRMPKSLGWLRGGPGFFRAVLPAYQSFRAVGMETCGFGKKLFI